MNSVPESIQEGLKAPLIDLIDRVYQGLAGRFGSTLDKAKLSFNVGFSEYLRQTRERCLYTKTLINRYEPANVRELYVPLRFKFGRQNLESGGVVGRVKSGRQVIVTGIAGSGKSLTLKKIYVDLIDAAETVPVFVELRGLNQYDGSLAEYICDEISSFTGEFTEAGLEFGLRKGLITLLLDGFDEVSKNRQPKVERELHDLISSAPKCKILLSGRPSARYHSWHSVIEARILNLDKDQVIDLISRITFDEGRKLEFSERVENNLYATHRKLLANPLLCCLMLLTFDEFSEIPASMHVYYRKAFEVLVRKHDSLKPQYVREFGSELTEEQLRRLFESFCYFSFIKSKFNFDIEGLNSIVSEAILYEDFVADASLFIRDLVENVCIMLNEGDEYYFIHRSFQEYFTASFLIGRNHEGFLELLNYIGGSFLDAEVLNFMVEMNSEALERAYLIPALKLIVDRIRDTKSQLDKYCEVYVGVFVLEDGNLIPTIDIFDDGNWYGSGSVAIERISKRKIQLSGLDKEARERLFKQHVLSDYEGRLGVYLDKDVYDDFAGLIKYLELGDQVQRYFEELQAQFSLKERKRDRLLGKRGSGRAASRQQL